MRSGFFKHWFIFKGAFLHEKIVFFSINKLFFGMIRLRDFLKISASENSLLSIKNIKVVYIIIWSKNTYLKYFRGVINWKITCFCSDHSSCGDAESLRDSIDTPPLRIVTVKSMAELCNPPDTNGRESSDLDMDEDGEVVIEIVTINHHWLCSDVKINHLKWLSLKTKKNHRIIRRRL